MVLTSIGILQFDDQGEVPKDFVPLVSSKLTTVSPDDVNGITTAFRIAFGNGK